MNDAEKISREDLLKPENMILMYARGAFPMADETGEINWYSPEKRTIIPLDNYNYPRSLRKFMDKSGFEYRYDSDTIEVIKQCADRDLTWISDDLIRAYKGLVYLGHIHSISVFKDDLLVGGLYGVTYMGAFFGESMFSHVSQASKAALIKLIERLNTKGFTLLDVQFKTSHLAMFGAIEIQLEDFNALLMKAYSVDASF